MQGIIKTRIGNRLTRMLKNEQVEIEAAVKSEIAIARKLADSTIIKQHFASPGNLGMKRQADEEIESYRRAFPEASILWINDIDRMSYADGNRPYWVDADDPANHWYHQTVFNTKDYCFNINYNHAIEEIRLWINAPVFGSNGKPLGMVAIGVEPAKFFNKIYARAREGATLFFFNENEEISGAEDFGLLYPKVGIGKKLRELLGPKIDFSSAIAMAKELEPAEVQTLDAPNGQVAIGRVPALNWYSIAYMPIRLGDYRIDMTWLFVAMVLAIVLSIIIYNMFIDRYVKSLHRALESLETASNVKNNFLAKMSHEIRTPMNAITGMAELALREELPHAAREHLYTIRQSGSNLLAIINDLLDFAKLESGMLEITTKDYLFSSLINDTISIIRMRTFESGLKLVVNIDSNIPNMLIGDEVRVRQVLLNILGNAVKYTRKGHVSLIATGEQSDENSILLTIQVMDTGIGIKPEDTEKIFGEFVQVDSVANRGIEGTGLGLSITSTLVKAMGGTITVQSKYGEGSTFTLTIPQGVRSLQKIAQVENPGQKSVLVYETCSVYADSIVRTVGNLGIACTLVSDGAEFEEKMASGAYQFAFVASELYESVRDACQKNADITQSVMLAGFGEAVVAPHLSILSMPAYSISVAGVLNGNQGEFEYLKGSSQEIWFEAPDAVALIVDDVATNLNVAMGLLSLYEIQSRVCKSGLEAIEAIQKPAFPKRYSVTKDGVKTIPPKLKYDFVLMDHMMPEMDGVEATKRIRALGERDPYFKNVPIIALTANAVSGAKEMFLANGFNDFISKPVEMVQLSAILEKWVPKDKQRKRTADGTINISKQGMELEIEGLNTAKGLAMSAGSLENYLGTLKIFMKDGKEKLKEINAALETKNLPLFAIYAHALKSAAANIGALELSDLAKTLEMAGKQEDMNYVQEHAPNLLESLEKVVGSISRVIDEVEESKPEGPTDTEKLKSLLAGLKEAIDSIDPRAIKEASEALKPFARAEGVGGAVESILNRIQGGEDDEAVDEIDLLANTL
jgi:signal transduction histidine kinase/CheY-like chemotaxis protein/HPt (histidine-containing phosphotransfer) domain-containing protein